ncbi:SWR1 complex subunit 2 [Hondaea fermentalgiana]|uniref:SWR1 complex subunit 2 n=1 Tax=Hondaea fermentalgiana TaxID=2315210 RepID=A0A2R5G116_9STRA|nr:SWR1 complex subunit 2 [Hondaea fermentalgiana]|eukprot:GBG23989.1 SWR1 complex subunit 2 [Hondaea fermentalgiana]
MARDEWGSTLQDELGVQLPAQEAGRRRTTRADAEKRERRQKTRRWTAYDGVDALQRKRESRLERLECTNVGDALVEGDDDGAGDGADSDEFVDLESDADSDDSSDDEDDGNGDGKPKRKRKRAASKKAKAKMKKGNSKAASGSGKASAATASKSRKRSRSATNNRANEPRRKLRSLMDILLDENANKLSTVDSLQALDTPDYFNARAGPPRYPARRLCAVTGVPAPYKDPESGLYYAHGRAFEQLREQPPPWVKASATAPFHEAMRIIADERTLQRGRLSKESA